MSKALSPKVIHTIVREWLCSKDAVLTSVIESIARELVPVATEAAQSMIAASFEPDPRDHIIEQMVWQLQRVLARLDYLEESPSPEIQLARSFSMTNTLRQEIACVLGFVQTQRVEMLEEGDNVTIGLAPAKGGAS